MIITLDSSDLLIAPPKMPDLRFRKTVLMLTHEHENGMTALCVNKPTTHTLADIAREINLDVNINFPLYWGGPVNHGTIRMLHSNEWSIDSTLELNDQWSMTSNIAMFHHLADQDTPKFFRMMFGFCTWAPGQLEAELKGTPPWHHESSWLVAKNPGPEWLFESDPSQLWESATDLCSHQAVDSWL